jgi:arginyl-tRNA synthetase
LKKVHANTMENNIKEALLSNSIALFGVQIDEELIQFQSTRKEFTGDLTLVVFPFVKLLKISPQEVGSKIGDFLQQTFEDISSFNCIQGFLNLSLSDNYWIQVLSKIENEDNFAFEKPNSKSLMMVEYASPNTNKPLHLGHLRNIFLGDSVARILKANGHEVIKTQIINDRGIHICKSMLAWERFSPINEKGERETPENTGIKGDKLVGKYYVLFDKNFNIEAKEIVEKWKNNQFDGFEENTILKFQKLNQAKIGKDDKSTKEIDDKIFDLAKNETALLRDAKEMLIKWEARDPQVYLLWSTMNSWVYRGFESTYTTMQVEFDHLYYESETFLIGKDLVVEGLKRGIFYKKEDNSIWVDLTDDGLDEKLLLRSDGTAVYMTQDLGTAYNRFIDYPNLNGVIYTVGNEQDYHFKVLFLILEKLGYTWAKSCSHLSYGMVDLPSGKMKSREGTVVDADDLMLEVIESAKEMTQQRGHIEGMSDSEKEKLYHQIGMGGLKYYLLKVDPKKRMLFDPEESIELNGNTGPFIQYAYARIQSLLLKNEITNDFFHAEMNVEEKEIIKQISLYPQVIQESAKELSPALLANYIYELVKTFNHFYQTIPINIEANQSNKNLRLVICKNVANVIRSTMNLLGIEVPQKM